MLLWPFFVILAWPFQNEIPDDQVIARAKGLHAPIEITAGRLKAYAKGREDQTPQKLLQDLIDFELLADEAQSQGLAQHPEVQNALSQPMVADYLTENFEKTYSLQSIPRNYVEQAYRQNQHLYVHPDLRNAIHLLITGDHSRMPADSDQVEKARALAQKISNMLSQQPIENKDEFSNLAEQFRPEVEAAGFQLKIEDLGLFAQQDRYDPDFTAPCFEVQAEGQLTPPIRTIFGFHIAYIAAVIPAISKPLSEVEDEIRQRILNDFRALEFKKLVEHAGQTYESFINPQPLEAIEQRRGLNNIEP